MNEYDGIITELKILGGKASFSQAERERIDELYLRVLGKQLQRTSCNDCYRDAVYVMYSHLRKSGKLREESRFRLKNGVVIQDGFGTANFYTNANLTDDVATRYLQERPEAINLFAVIPDGWKRTIRRRKK